MACLLRLFSGVFLTVSPPFLLIRISNALFNFSTFPPFANMTKDKGKRKCKVVTTLGRLQRKSHKPNQIKSNQISTGGLGGLTSWIEYPNLLKCSDNKIELNWPVSFISPKQSTTLHYKMSQVQSFISPKQSFISQNRGSFHQNSQQLFTRECPKFRENGRGSQSWDNVPSLWPFLKPSFLDLLESLGDT